MKAHVIIAGALVALALGSSSTSWAQSQTYGVAEVKFGGYVPAIDSEVGGTPYQSYFGNDDMWFVETEWDLHLLKGIGVLSLGFHAGYSSIVGDIKSADGTSGDTVPGETSLNVVPLRTSIVYRYDYSAIHHNVPLVPVLKAGLDYHLWWVTDGSGATANADGVAGEGGKAGWHASLGVNLLLDVVSPRTAAIFDLNWGVNNSYLFGEYVISRIDGFGAPGFDLSSEQLLFGLAFEF